jgi:hypothetical protein
MQGARIAPVPIFRQHVEYLEIVLWRAEGYFAFVDHRPLSALQPP